MQQNTEYNQRRRNNRLFRRKNGLLPNRYVFILTNKCNLKCSFCFQDRRQLPKAMTTQHWKETLDKLPPNSHVTLTGGEPLAFKDFEEVFLYACNKYTVNIITNGVLLSKQKADLFLGQENLQTLSISIDTIGNVNRDVKDFAYENMKEVLNYIQDNKPNSKNHKLIIDAKTVVVEENISDLPDIYLHCVNDLRVDSHAIQFLKGSDVQHSDKMYSYESIFEERDPYIYQNVTALAESILKIKDYVQKTGIPSYCHPSWFDDVEDKKQTISIINNKINQTSFDPFVYEKCGSPWESAHINADGKIFPCLAIDFGDVREFSNLQDIYASGIAKQFRDELFKCGSVPACDRCGYLLLNDQESLST